MADALGSFNQLMVASGGGAVAGLQYISGWSMTVPNHSSSTNISIPNDARVAFIQIAAGSYGGSGFVSFDSSKTGTCYTTASTASDSSAVTVDIYNRGERVSASADRAGGCQVGLVFLFYK